MDCPGSPADHMYPSSAPRLSCTTQSDPVNPRPGFADENPIMVMSPQQIPQDRRPLADHYSPSLPPSPSYSSQQQVSTYTSSEPLAYIGSPISSQQLVARQQIWATPQVSSWAGEATNYAFSDAAAQRGLSWNGFNQGSLEPWMSPEHYQQLALGGETAYPQPLYPATAEQLHSYSHSESSITAENAPYCSYPSMSPALALAGNFSLGDSSSASGPTVRGLVSFQGSHFDTPPSPPARGEIMATSSTGPRTSSPLAGQSEAEAMQSTPTTPASHFKEESTAGHYAEAASASLGPSGRDDKRASSVPAEPNNSAETPYAQLIYQALISRPRRAMRLQEIYQWFLENTNKGQDGTKGWQNSIRHNLSMNGAFERRPINSGANDSGDECSSPSGAQKQAAEWVLLDSAVKDGLLSTTRYRNPERRGQNNRSRRRNSRPHRTSRRPSRAQVAARPTVLGYSLPPLPRSFRRHDYRLRSNYGQYGPQYDSLAEQLEQSSLDEQRRAMYFAGGNDYQHAMQSSYASPPLIYSPELFMPSVQGAPTVISDSDDNEAMTPETSFAVLEPTVLLPGDNNSGTPGPTSDPYSRGPSAYYSSPNTSNSHAGPRYTMGDVAGVAEENTLRCCGWNSNPPYQQ